MTQAPWAIHMGIQGNGFTLVLAPGAKTRPPGINRVFISIDWNLDSTRAFLNEMSDDHWQAAVKILTGDKNPHYEIIEMPSKQVVKRYP